MGHLLLWIEHVLLVLSLSALLLMLLARIRRAWLRVGLIGLLMLIVVAFHVGLAAVMVVARGALRLDVPVVAPVALAVVVAVGLLVLAVVLHRRDRAGKAMRPGRTAAVVAVVLGLYVMTFWNLDLAMRDELNTARLEAGAMMLAAAPAHVPDRDNAALVYARAIQLMQPDTEWPEGWNTGRWESDLKDRANPSLPDDPQLRALLTQKQPALELFHRGAQLPGYYIGHPWHTPSIDWLLPHLVPMRSAARLLDMDARVRLIDGDVDGAVRNVNTMLRISRHLAEEPLLISTLVAVAVHELALGTTEALLSEASAEQLAQVDLSELHAYTRNLRRGMTGERAFQIATLAGVARNPKDYAAIQAEVPSIGSAPQAMAWGGPAYRVFFQQRDMASAHRIWNLYREAMAKPYYQAEPIWQQAEQVLGSGPVGLMTRILMPALSRAHTVMARVDSRHRVVVAAVAMRRYRLDHGQYPQSLEALVPAYLMAVPNDPCAPGPIRLIQTEQGPAVYSIGTDLTDDQATPFEKQMEKGDIVVVLPTD